MRSALITVIVAVAVNCRALAGAAEPEPPSVPSSLIENCPPASATDCLLDLAWALAAEEKRPFQLARLARDFAWFEDWSHAEMLLTKIPEKAFWKATARADIDGERLVRQLAKGQMPALAGVHDVRVLSHAARRFLGYGDWRWGYQDHRTPRDDQGFAPVNLVKAPRPVVQALLARWEALLPEASDPRRATLAGMTLLSGDLKRGRRILAHTRPKAEGSHRYLIGLWLHLGESAEALSRISASKPRNRGFYRWLIAEWLLEHGKEKEAIPVAVAAAEDLLEAREFGRLIAPIDLLVRLGQPETARRFVVAAADSARKPDAFRPFNVTALGPMFLAVGERDACMKLQDEALELLPRKGEVVGHGFHSGPVTYGGRYNLEGNLRQEVAIRRVACGDRKELAQVDNRTFGRYYCGYLRANLLGLPELIARTDDKELPRFWVLSRGADCHLSRREDKVGDELLRIMRAEKGASTDFTKAKALAELACIYRQMSACREALAHGWRTLMKEVAQGKRPAGDVLEFAKVWADPGRRPERH